MSKNKKVPSNCSSIGTSSLLMIPLKNKNAISLYTKKSFISSIIILFLCNKNLYK